MCPALHRPSGCQTLPLRRDGHRQCLPEACRYWPRRIRRHFRCRHRCGHCPLGPGQCRCRQARSKRRCRRRERPSGWRCCPSACLELLFAPLRNGKAGAVKLRTKLSDDVRKPSDALSVTTTGEASMGALPEKVPLERRIHEGSTDPSACVALNATRLSASLNALTTLKAKEASARKTAIRNGIAQEGCCVLNEHNG